MKPPHQERCKSYTNAHGQARFQVPQTVTFDCLSISAEHNNSFSDLNPLTKHWTTWLYFIAQLYKYLLNKEKQIETRLLPSKLTPNIA